MRRNKPPSTLLGFRPSRDDIAAVDALAAILNITRSEVLRRALHALASHHIKPVKEPPRA